MMFDRYSTSLTRYSYINFRKSHSDIYGEVATTQPEEFLGAFIFRGARADNVFDSAASIRSRQDGTADGTVPGRIEFLTSSSETKDQIRMTIKSDGNVGIGTETPSAELHVAGSGKFDNGIAFVAPLGDLSMGTFTNSPAN
jgi:hypothetical protein